MVLDFETRKAPLGWVIERPIPGPRSSYLPSRASSDLLGSSDGASRRDHRGLAVAPPVSPPLRPSRPGLRSTKPNFKRRPMHMTANPNTQAALLKALKALLDCCELNLDELEADTVELIEAAEEAIAQAEGRTRETA